MNHAQLTGGQKLRLMRKLYKLRAHDIANAAQVSRANVSHMEQNGRPISPTVQIVFDEQLRWSEHFLNMVFEAIKSHYDHETAETLISALRMSLELAEETNDQSS